MTVDCELMFRAESAGEGIEYSWGYAEQLYSRKLVASKKGRENFKALVRLCTDPRDDIDKFRVRTPNTT
jgi:hypothetical protein